ncbi:5-bromo-4-chloroindolyl phosphate hydrolysis family protein [Gorillibacterium massiliense]|uniref:5-bromo-4-chloroindolyl phosphate hydrolysis family protein n=1 Tax=Gorillibacterium massiliense TaxID=1280390 RepID=UPI0004B7798E|nr:5-bromo-4-chloroindolyl phosphate hydrolysis family protein [Gorillibacterium massiliense]
MQTLKGILAGLLGAGVILLFLFGIRASFWLSFASGAAVYGAVLLIWRNKPIASLPLSLDETSIDFYKRTIEEGRIHVKAIKSYIPLTGDPAVQVKIKKIADISDRIFEVLEQKPQSVKIIRQYFTYDLESTSKILNKYTELKRKGLTDPEVIEIIARTESQLDLIADLFEKKLKKLVSDDVLDLDVELDMLQQMLKTEGMQ